ncbi:MAG: hypothetical protein LUC90_07390 [Lachnospiraceae bacterium]|nr:hypothetical protein [Lachnospiraceae bacterium]
MHMLRIILLVVLLVLIIGLVALYFTGKRAQKKQAEQQAMLEEHKQYVSMLIIDKKTMPLKEAGLPDVVLQETPWYLKRSKVPVVKAKIGPQITTLMCDASIFDSIPVKKEVRAAISGLYIMEVKALHGKLPTPEPKKQGWWKRTVANLQKKAGAEPLKKKK